jgi:hypothetical protein
MATPPNPLSDQLFQARLKANAFVQEHLKTMVTVASGTLVLTVSFVKDVVSASEGEAHLPKLLALSWGALGLAIFCGTFALAVLVNNLDDVGPIEDGKVPTAFSAGKRNIVLRWEWFTIGSFGIGMLALALFGMLNHRLFLHSKAPEKPATCCTVESPDHRFVIASTPEHLISPGKTAAHTFLVDQNNGRVWQMICSKGKTVSFKKVDVEGMGSNQHIPVLTRPR